MLLLMILLNNRGDFMKSELNMAIGERVKNARKSNNMTREALSEKCDLSVQFIADIESGKKSMTTTSLYKISRALLVSCDYIVLGETENVKINNISSALSQLDERRLSCVQKIINAFIEAQNDLNMESQR